MNYILTGRPDSIRKVLQENAIRVHRGEIKFIPVTEANYNALVADDKFVVGLGEDKKNPEMPIDKKTPVRNKKKQ